MVKESEIVEVTLTDQEVSDVEEYVRAVAALGFEPEFEIIGDPNGEYNIGRKRRFTEEEHRAVMEYLHAAHTFTLADK